MRFSHAQRIYDIIEISVILGLIWSPFIYISWLNNNDFKTIKNRNWEDEDNH